MKKKIGAFLLALCMILGLCPTVALAENKPYTVTLVPVNEDGEELSSNQIDPGTTFGVAVYVANNKVDIGTLAADITYNSTVLQRVDYKKEGKKPTFYKTEQILGDSYSYNDTEGWLTVGILAGENPITAADTDEYPLFIVHFKVLEGAASGETSVGIRTSTRTEGAVWAQSDQTTIKPTYVPCTLTVTGGAEPQTVSVTGVTLNKDKLELTEGGEETLSATVEPDGATTKTVTWSSSDETVATVAQDGTVTAKKAGTATITVTTTDGSKIATCVVTVTCAHKNATKTEAKAATCREAGNDAYFHCSACGKYFAVGTDGNLGEEKKLQELTLAKDPAAHNFAEGWSHDENQHWYACQNGDCTEKDSLANHNWVIKENSGTATGHKVVCSVCDYEKGSEVAHGDSSTAADDFNNVTYQQIENDNNQHKKMLGCGGYILENHTWNKSLEVVTNATCTTPVVTKHVCKDCGYEWNEVTGSALGHTYAQTGAKWNDDHTECEFTLTCNREGCTDSTEGHTKTVEANGADIEKTPVKAPSCEAVGSDKYTATIISDGVAYTDEVTVEVAKLPHTFGAWNDEVPATCMAAGTKGHKYCSACEKNYDASGVEITDLTIAIVPDAHSFGDWIAEVPATCTTDGVKEHYTCSVCGKDFDADKVELDDLTIDALNHDWSAEWSKDGTTHWHACNRTGCSAKNDEVDHTYDQQVKTAEYLKEQGDCTTPNTYYKSCVCGAKGTETFQDNAPGHKTEGVEWSKNETEHWKVCDTCQQQAGKAEHTYNQEVANEEYRKSGATCTARAVYYKSCVCGAVDKSDGAAIFESGETLPHTYNQEVANDEYLKSGATCTAKAVYYKSCECGEKGTATFEYGNLLPHTYNKEVATEKYLKTPATCTAKAVYYKSCVCGAVDKSETAATFVYGEMLPHSLVKTPAAAATCTADGNDEYWTCSVCKQVFEDEAGTQETTVAAETLTKLGHDMTETPAKAATCTTDGNNKYYHCDRCNKYFKDEAGATETTVAAETLPKLGHSFTEKLIDDAHRITPANCQHAAVYCYDCSRCAEMSDTETFAYGATDPHSYIDGKCKDCGAVNPMKDVKTGNIAPATEVGGETVATENTGKVVADNAGLVIKTETAADNAQTVADIKAAVEQNSTVVTFDNNVNTTIPDDVTDGGESILTDLANSGNVTLEQQAELNKIVVELGSYNDNPAKKNVKVEQVVDVSLELIKVGSGETLGEVKELAQPIEIRIPASQSLIKAFNNSNKVVKAIISHTEVNGDVTPKEVDVTYDSATKEAVIRMDAFSTVAFVTYENVGGGSHSSGSSAPSGARTITTDLPVGSINAVFVNGKKLDSKYYVINGSSVTLTEAYMSTLKAGRYTIRIENATHMSTATIEVAADGVLSAKTGDMGLGMWYAMMGLSALLAVALVVKKRREA